MSFGYTVQQFGIDTNTLPIIKNLILWLDAADPTTISIGTGISQWNDKSGNHNHFTQGTGSNQPTVLSKDQNGLDVVDFNGTTQFMDAASTIIIGNTGRTLFFIVLADIVTNARPFFSLNRITSGAGTGYWITSSVRLNVQNGNRQWEGAGNNLGTNYAIATFYTLFNASVATQAFYRKNGVPQTPTGSNGATIITANNNTTHIGDSNASTVFFDGKLGEVIVYDKVLSLTEIESVENYLSVKWGISI